MRRFRARELDVLVSTTVIEVGVDVPNATVMVILSAERFGIAQLHQLRGRVGRGADRSWCYLVGHEEAPPGKEGRLAAMVRTQDGFELAEVDLDLRGEGTIMGELQKGRSDLKLASLRRDREWVVAAREVALELVDADPGLVHHRALAREVELFLDEEEREFLPVEGLMPVAWLPDDFVHPLRVDVGTAGHHLRPITEADTPIDYPAVMGSQPRLWTLFGAMWGWPTPDMTYEHDRADLARHEREIEAHQSFNYALLDAEEAALLGCIYIDPPGDDEVDGGCVGLVSWWVVDELVGSPVAAALDLLVPSSKSFWLGVAVRHAGHASRSLAGSSSSAPEVAGPGMECQSSTRWADYGRRNLSFAGLAVVVVASLPSPPGRGRAQQVSLPPYPSLDLTTMCSRAERLIYAAATIVPLGAAFVLRCGDYASSPVSGCLAWILHDPDHFAAVWVWSDRRASSCSVALAFGINYGGPADRGRGSPLQLLVGETIPARRLG